MGLRKILDKVSDALVPKEIAPFLGPAAMAFAGPLGMPLALGIGQLGAAKMMSGKLDPYSALGTILSAQGYKARNPRGYGSVARGLKSGLGTFAPGGATPMDFGSEFMKGFNTRGNLGQIYPADLEGEQLEQYKSKQTDLERSDYIKSIQPEEAGFFDKATQSIGKTIFPGFYDGDEFSFGRALTTIGAATTIGTLAPMAEELKKQRIKDKEQEGKLFREWFDSYKRISGRDYIDSEFPDPTLTEKYKEFMMAEGGRVGYNMGGGIMDAAPGVPPGMELDYRESGGFIPMGSQEKKDDVPAVLAKNEFVLTSDAMTGLDKMMGGSGDPRAAAKYMYQMMDQLEAMA
tara:strand:+ start:152 stop:1189 length:1038 start_codon:yes stop_codon:yes gene_type:complete